MKTRIQKWGNSLAVRIPKSFALEADLQQDNEVNLSLLDGRLIVEPIAPGESRWNLEELLNAITDENRHQEVATGQAIGIEVW